MTFWEQLFSIRKSVDEEIAEKLGTSVGTIGAEIMLEAALKQKEQQEKEKAAAPVVVPQPVVDAAKPPRIFAKPRLLTTAEIIKHYGLPGDASNQVTITTPFVMTLDWPPYQKTSKMTVHKKIAPYMLAVLNEIHQVYGFKKMDELELDQFGGCYFLRPQRGTEKKYAAAKAAGNTALALTYMSRHGWAFATDWNPDKNMLKMSSKTAQFAKPEYKAFNDIWYKHGFIGYGRERGNDWMHYEFGLLL